MAILRRAPFGFNIRGVLAPPHVRHASSGLTIGLRREDPARIWERRCPLTPEAIHELVRKESVNVLVQPCERRVYTMRELREAGAIPHDTLSPAHIILGIKETPLSEVLTDPIPLSNANGETTNVPRTHVMFSHTHKGQEYNTQLLSKFLNPSLSQEPDATRPRLIDYELLTDEHGQRTVGFGWFAGVAGALESLSALAHALLERGIASPFLSTPRPHTHPSLPSLKQALRSLVGDRIASEGTPESFGPVIICVTGTGKVAQGALDLLAELPIQHVKVDELPALLTDPHTDLHKIYVVRALPKDYFVRSDGKPYNRNEYYAHPEAYTSVFHSRIAPYVTLLLNGAGWAQGFPRIMGNEHLEHAMSKGRFVCVGDISCDVQGSLEFLPRHSTLSDPHFTTRPSTLPAHLPPLTMMAVDILPTALPREASEHFSDVLKPYLKAVIAGYTGKGDKGKEAEVERATIASAGVLRAEHAWLGDKVRAWKESKSASASASPAPNATLPLEEKSSKEVEEKRDGKPEILKRNVLMFGSGMVAAPAIDEIASHADVRLVVASNELEEARRLTCIHSNAQAVRIDMSDLPAVESLVEQADVVVSLLPVPLHPQVAEVCLKYKKHMVTASYISPAMRALHDRALAADVILLNEIGLDPGIDHCSAISLLSQLQKENKRVTSFTSFCGGLPAPEYADVPLKYKFSWSPRGVLGAALNGARFKLWDQAREVEGKNILKDGFPELPVSEVLKLEGIANRDSLSYADTYSLGKLADLRTLVRGTIRYPGFSSLMHSFKSIGLLDTEHKLHLQHWTGLPRSALSHVLGIPVPADAASFLSAVLQLVPEPDAPAVIDALGWLGLLPSSASHCNIPLPAHPSPAIDLFANVLAHQLRYHPGERDLVLLSHEIVARPAHIPGTQPVEEEEVHTSTLVAYGDERASAMARTVGLPLAFAVRAVLDGVKVRGVCGPGVGKEVWGAILEGLEGAGLGMKESVARRTEKGGKVERALVGV